MKGIREGSRFGFKKNQGICYLSFPEWEGGGEDQEQ